MAHPNLTLGTNHPERCQTRTQTAIFGHTRKRALDFNLTLGVRTLRATSEVFEWPQGSESRPCLIRYPYCPIPVRRVSLGAFLPHLKWGATTCTNTARSRGGHLRP